MSNLLKYLQKSIKLVKNGNDFLRRNLENPISKIERIRFMKVGSKTNFSFALTVIFDRFMILLG